MHGTFKGKPPGGDPGGYRGPSGFRLMLLILAREAAVGFLLYATLGRDPRTNALCFAAVCAGLVILTRKHGLLKRKEATGMATECVVILCGALAFRNLLILLV